MSAAEKTRIQLCGQLSVQLDGRQVVQALRGRQVRLLLAYLLLNRSRAVGREELIGALWPEQAPLSQDAALRTLLSRLRSAVGAASLPGRDEVLLSLPEPVWIDYEAARSELARALAALERDDARGAWGLAQVPLNISTRGLLPGAQANWLEPHRRDLADVRLEALEVIGRAGLRLGGGQLGSVERAARALIEAEPYRESGYTLLMQSQALRGNVAEAVRVFDQLRILLREELGTTPSSEAIAAHEQLLRGAPATPASRGGRSPEVGVELPAELRARAQAPLIGRQAELRSVAVRGQAVTRQVPLERLVGLAVDEADQGIRPDRLADLCRGRLLDSRFGRRVGSSALTKAGKCGVDTRDEGRQLGHRNVVVRHVRGDDVIGE